MLLSIIVHGRNDRFAKNFTWRCQTVLNGHGRAAVAAGGDVEVVLCDWGSSRPLLHDLRLEDAARQCLRCCYVNPEIAQRYSRDSEYPSSYAINVAARRAVGEYLCVCDADTYWRIPTMVRLLGCLQQHALGDMDLRRTFFWASRYHVPQAYNHSNPTLEDLNTYIDKNILPHDKFDMHNFSGAALALLVHKDMFAACGGFDEQLIYWGRNDTQVTERLQMRYAFGGDLEDYGMTFYHLEHYSMKDGVRNLVKENPRKINIHTPVRDFNPNDDGWGLRDEPIVIM